MFSRTSILLRRLHVLFPCGAGEQLIRRFPLVTDTFLADFRPHRIGCLPRLVEILIDCYIILLVDVHTSRCPTKAGTTASNSIYRPRVVNSRAMMPMLGGSCISASAKLVYTRCPTSRTSQCPNSPMLQNFSVSEPSQNHTASQEHSSHFAILR